MAKSTTFKTDLLKFELQGIALPAGYAGPYYVALHTADPGDAGTATTNEAAYTSYARQLIARTTLGFAVNGSIATNVAVILFPARSGGGTPTVTHFSIVTTASGAGTILERGAFSTPLLVNGTVRPRIPIGGISIAEDSVDGGSSVITPAGILGTNIEGLSDYTSSNWATINVFKCSRPMLSGTIGGAFYDVDANFVPTRTFPKDADGYPTSLLADQRAQSIILLAAGYPTGNYIVTWDGIGTLNVVPAVPGSSIVSSAANRIVFNLPISTADGVYISIDSTTPGNYVKNIKVKHVDHEFNDNIWHPAFVASLSYYSTLRFMDLMKTNDSTVSTWSQRCTLTSATWADENGAPVEALVDLANKANANPWFCMPHLADDAFIYDFADIVRTTLNEHLKIYVECSNEVWNFQFGQAQYALTQANLSPLFFGTDGAGWIRWHSDRSRNAHGLWSLAFGGSDRLVRVIGAQASNSYLLDQACLFLGNGANFDAAAIGPYFGYRLGLYDTTQGGMGATVAGWTESRLLDEIEANQMAEVVGWIDGHIAVTNTHGLDLIAYECGQHLVRVGTSSPATDAALDAVLIGVQDTARMGAFYTLFFEMLKSKMDRPLCHFTHAGGWGQYGSWGARQSLAETVASSPKATALYDFSIANGGALGGAVTVPGGSGTPPTPTGGPGGYTNVVMNDVFGSTRTDANMKLIGQFNPATEYGATGTGWDKFMNFWSSATQANITMATDHLVLEPTGIADAPGFITSHLEVLPTVSTSYYIEVRCQTGRGSYTSSGAWPAIWLYAGNSPGSFDQQSEIDIMEQYVDQAFGSVAVSGAYPQYFNTTIHGLPAHATKDGPKTTLTTGIDVTTSWNVYGCELTLVAGEVHWKVYFNGTLAQTATSNIAWASSAPALIIGWNPGSSAFSPAQMKLDYVRVWSK